MTKLQQLIDVNEKIRIGEINKDKELLATVLSNSLIFQRANQTIVDKETYLSDLSYINYTEVKYNSIESKFDKKGTKAVSIVYVKAKGENTKDKREIDGVYRNVRFFREEKHFLLCWKKPQWRLCAWYNEKSENNAGDQTRLENEIDFKDELKFPLWQFFEDRAQNIKERLWMVFSFHAAILISLVGFIINESCNGSSDCSFLIISSLSGLFYTLFVIFQLNDIKYHIERNYDRANNVKDKIVGLESLIDAKTTTENHNRCFSSNNYPQLILIFSYSLLCIFVGLSLFFIVVSIINYNELKG